MVSRSAERLSAFGITLIDRGVDRLAKPTKRLRWDRLAVLLIAADLWLSAFCRLKGW